MNEIINTPEAVATLDKLTVKGKNWENGALKVSNEELYGILAEAMPAYEYFLNNRTEIKMFNHRLKEKGIIFNKSTSLAVKTIRWIFPNCAGREFAYAAALGQGKEEGQTQETLAQWIISQNGVENIRLKNHPKKATTEELATIAIAKLEDANTIQSLGDTDLLDDPLKPNKEGENNYSVALLEATEDGTTQIVYGSNKETVVSKLLAEAGREFRAADKAEAKSA